MNISLRRASALQNSIQEVLRSISIEPVIKVDEFKTPGDTVLAANKTLVENDARRVALTIAYYNIRSLIGVANVSCGISMKLATAAFVDRRIAQLQELIAVGARDLVVVEKKIEKIRSSTDTASRLYGHDNVTTSVLSEEQIVAFKSELIALKKQKQTLNDEILELNIKTEVPLGENTIKTLTAEQLV